MVALFNNNLTEDQLTLAITDRALQFGDGLFETISVTNQKPAHLEAHLDRLQRGAEVLGMEIPETLNVSFIKSSITLISTRNTIAGSARAKLQVWRKISEAGGYNFNEKDVNTLITVKPYHNRGVIKNKVAFANTVTYNHSAISRFKTLNSLPYVLAAKERAERSLDELIVLNNDGYVCECVASNIFWVKDQEFFTPHLESGCVEGIGRKEVIDRLALSGDHVREVLAPPEQLLQADHIFITNALGKQHIVNLEGKKYNPAQIKL